jgi:hypothetical protein
VFYDTLYEQNPDSHMAQEWCVAYGTLPVLEADRLHRIICKRKNIVVKSSPVKKSQSSSKSKNGSSSNGSAKKKAKTSAVVSDTGTYFAALDDGYCDEKVSCMSSIRRLESEGVRE